MPRRPLPPPPDTCELHYIYVLHDPRDGAVRYVGRTCNPKARQSGHRHLRPGGPMPPIDEWKRELSCRGLAPKLVAVACCPADRVAELESETIRHYSEANPGGILNMAGLRRLPRRKIVARWSRPAIGPAWFRHRQLVEGRQEFAYTLACGHWVVLAEPNFRPGDARHHTGKIGCHQCAGVKRVVGLLPREV